MVTVPGATAVARPEAEIVAMPAFELDQLIAIVVAVVSVIRAVAVNCCVKPTVTVGAEAGDTVIEANVGAPGVLSPPLLPQPNNIMEAQINVNEATTRKTILADLFIVNFLPYKMYGAFGGYGPDFVA